MRIHNFILGSRSLIKDFSIRFFAIVLFLSILVFSGSSLTLLKIQNQEFLQESSIIFQEFKKFIVPPLWHYDDAEINAICRTFLSGGMVAKITIFSDNNKPLYTFGGLNEKNILFESFSEDLFFKAKKIGKVDFYTKREKYLESNRYYFFTTIIAIALISVFISIATWKLLHIYVSRPLAKLLLWINQIKKGDYESVNIDFPQKEIQDVVHHFALMVDKIKEREQELRKSEQQYRSLFENTGTATFVVEEDMTVSQINAKCEELIEYPKDEIEGRMKTSDFVGDENIERIKQYHFGRRNEPGVYPSEYEIELIDKNGGTRNAIIQIGMISGTKKSIASIIDITPLRRAEAEIRSSEKRFRSLVANIPGAIYRCDKDPDWTMRFFSEAIADICGYPASDFIGDRVRAYQSIIHPDDRALVNEALGKSVESGEPFKIEYRIHDAEDKVRWVYESGMGVLEAGGKAQYIDGAIFDITERKISDEALRESESRYRTLFNSANDTIFIMQDDTFVDCNQKALVMFGCTREQIIGHRPHEFSPPTQPDGKRSKEKVLENVRAVLEGKPQFFEWKHRRSDATLFDAEVSLNLVELNNGLHVQAITRDISKRKRAEAAMRISHRIINHSIDMICVAGFDGFFKVLNPAWERVLDWSREELLSKPWTDFVHPDDREVTKHTTSAMMDGTEIRQFENRYLSKDGSVKWLSWTAHPYPDEEIIFAVARDVTESKRTENEMAQLRIQLKNIIDSMPSLLVAVDLEGRVNLWNTQAENKTGVSAELAQRQFLPDVFPQLTIGLDKVRDTIANKKPHIDTKVPQAVDHGIHYQDITVYPLIANDVEGAVIRVDDVTERVRMEEMVIQSEKMLSVGGLAAGMAHEINNPLAGIMQNVDLVLRRLTEDIPANLKTAAECGTHMATIRDYIEKRDIPAYMGDVHKAGARASGIVKNMLSFARMGEGIARHHDVCELLDRTVEMAASDYDLKKKYDFRLIEVVREYDAGTPKVLCEGSKIQQVFMNILKNGAQAMRETAEDPGHGAKRPRFILRVSKADEGVCIEIEDNGPGMDESVRKQVFVPFFSTKAVGTGTGLGLSVSYFIIKENHGGAMAVESRPGEGTKFIINLPLKR